MAIIKCKMCGGDLNIEEGLTVCECEYCGSKQTVPSADNEKKLTLFARANRLRAACEFDKAAGVYESIVADFPEEAEAYWGLVLCRYGIEYVDDPATGKKVPTCHRSSFESIMEDADFEQACENADAIARRVYRDEAKQLEEIRKGIIEVSGKEEPYDIFICYKETDESGDRTVDSVIAQDVYDALTDKGYRVFFSRISLEDKLGVEYEPYIFAALNSAKIMLAFGTDFEYYNAVWVKNEWSRFLKLMAADKSKYLIPCFKGIDAYDMPKEFAKLQAQDMGKVGAMQDLLRGVEKILPKNKSGQNIVQTVSNGPNTDSILKRGFMALEDAKWDTADVFFEKVLDMDAECAEAYLGKLMVELEVRRREELKNCAKPFDGCNNYQKILRFADVELVKTVRGYITFINDRNENARLTALYNEAASVMRAAKTEADFKDAAEKFRRITCFKDADEQAKACLMKADEAAEEARIAEEKNRKELNTVRELLRQANVEVSTSVQHTVGLKSDGSVVAVGLNEAGQCDVNKWRSIVAVSAGGAHTVGLRSDGTVVATKYTGNRFYNKGQCNVSKWRDIVAVSAGGAHTVGLRSDGTVVATEYTGKQNLYDGQCDVSKWCDIVAVSARYYHTVGLKSDGTVVAVGYNHDGQCDVSEWRDIVAVSAGPCGCTIGLKSDGTVVVTVAGYDMGDMSEWRDIVAVSAGYVHMVGLKSDGTVVATQYNVDRYFNHGQRNVNMWRLFESVDQLKKVVDSRQKAQIAPKASRLEDVHKKRETLLAEQNSLKAELPNLKGLFTGKRRKEIEARLAEIDAELKKLN